ncbi:VIT1/CCC1 transporter family protein [Streptococcus oralis]|uniref:VIT family protein n=1 Tax=Streptococcus oralis TaxID=1303 RepID=A0A3R9I0G2_STROR|nr:VIT family protein [Streptococcus oralis]RSI76907.1 VIT family protein [Streptococcus oralis]
MTEIKHEIDANFAGRLNILRAGVLGANDGIISIAGVVIGVASATSNIWIIFLSGLAAILAGAFSMAGGEYVSVSTQKDTEEAAVAREQLLLDKDIESAKQSLYAAYLQNGECETSAQLLTNKAFLKNPLKALVEEKYGIEYEEFTNPWHAATATSSFIAFVLGSLPPMLSITVFPSDYRIPATVFIVALSLLVTGYTSAKLGKAPTKTAMIRNLCIGLLTMGVTFLLGQLFSI